MTNKVDFRTYLYLNHNQFIIYVAEILTNEKIYSEKLEIEDVRAVLEMYKEDIKTTCPPILDYLEFGTTQEWQGTRPKSVPSLRNEHEHMLLHELHPLTHEAADFVDNNICKLSDKTKSFVEEWKTQLLEKDPIILEELKWFNKEKLGWSDDRWRP